MRIYLAISGLVFGFVALMHIARLAFGWAVQVDGWSAPLWISWLGALGAGMLCAWAIALVTRGT